MQHSKGFTLFEMMITIAVAAIILTLAVPGFTQLLQKNRLTSATDSFIRAYNQAKSNAIQNGLPAQLAVYKTESELRTLVGSAEQVCLAAPGEKIAWAVIQSGKAISCLSNTDYEKRFSGVLIYQSANLFGGTSFNFTPLGLSKNDKVSLEFKIQDKKQVVDIFPGGSIKLQEPV